MNMSFENKVALVTGAASGMGLTTARAFAEAGAAVALADVNENAVRSAAKEFVAAGHKAIGIRCNVADEAEVAAMVAQTGSTFGRLDAAFNNAGIQSPAVEMADVSNEEFERVNGINLRGVWNCMKYELLQMRKQGSGAIVNNSSIGGLIGIPGRAIYHATKHGVIGLTKSAALEYASRGIRINAICPGAIETPMVADMIAKEPETMKEITKEQPIGRLGQPEDRLRRVALRLRRRARLPWWRQPREVADRAQTWRPGDQRCRPAGRCVRRAGRPTTTEACDGTDEPQGPGAGQEPGRALLVLLYAGRWRATEDVGHSL